MNSDTQAMNHGANATLKPERRTMHYRGRVITVSTDLVQLPNGRRAELEVVQHPGGAAAVAVDEARRVCLLRQYRYVAGGWLWELPAGKLEPREPPLATAQRELAEEAGVSGREWRPLGTCLSSPGVFTEVLHLYLATGIGPAALAHERAEVIEIHWVPLETACEWALGGTITDCKTVVGLLRARFGPAGGLSITAGNNP
ncbi:MAG: NUDIX hydrolase [Steroidobacteraceae bacterium]